MEDRTCSDTHKQTFSRTNTQLQEKLVTLPWPKQLLSVQQCAPLTAGDFTGDPDAKGKGQLVIAGLRVRMGVNTGECIA